MFEGLPELVAYVTGLVQRKPQRGPLCMVIDHHLGGWVEPGGTKFLNVWNVSPFDRDERQIPDVLTTRVVCVRDRRANIRPLCVEGKARLAAMRQTLEAFATTLRASHTMDDLTAPHGETLSECGIGVLATPAVPSRAPRARRGGE